MKKNLVQKIITDLQTGYNTIAADFDRTRQHNWDVLSRTLRPFLRPDTRLLDAGCGSGRLVKIAAEAGVPISYVGLDSAAILLELAHKNFGLHYKSVSLQWQEGSLSDDLFLEESFDLIVAAASFHHIPSRALRREVIARWQRVLAPGGTLIMLNWYLWTRPAFHKYHLWRQIFLNSFRGYEWGDFFIPWKNQQQGIVAQRYYHSFTKREIAGLFAADIWVLRQNDVISVSGGDVAQSILTVAHKR